MSKEQDFSSDVEVDVEEEETSDQEEPRQCLALECCKSARRDSKYCSQKCCIQLAKDRLHAIMPERFAEWTASPCVAELRNQFQLRILGEKIVLARERVEGLEKRRLELEDYILSVEKLVAREDSKATSVQQTSSEEGVAACVSCGKELPFKSFVKHMEQCFLKVESMRDLSSPNSSFKPVGSPPIFCDTYNKKDSTYCKKFFSICAHQKKLTAKISSYSICGFPLVLNVNQATSEMCRSLKLKCNKHFGWEHVQRASIDVERLNGWVKLDDLVIEQSQIKKAVQERGNVMSLFLHRTTAHDTEYRPPQLDDLANQLKQEQETVVEDEQEIDVCWMEDGIL